MNELMYIEMNKQVMDVKNSKSAPAQSQTQTQLQTQSQSPACFFILKLNILHYAELILHNLEKGFATL